MLAPEGRAVLLDALRPPEGFDLGFAVATTFTLDLTAALVVPLAFATSQLGNAKDPIAVMEAVRVSADRVAVFCQAGNTVVPRQASDLVAFTETMVHEVHRPRPGHLFHPKVWVVRFDADGAPPQHRVLVLTRNLTLDRGWDLVLRLDGNAAQRRRNRDNEQLARLIESLPGLAITPLPFDKAEAVMALAQDLRSVLWELPEGVDEVRFWSYGIGRYARPDLGSGSRHLVVSPFLTAGGMAQFAESTDLTVVSRADELDRLEPGVLTGAHVYALDPLVGYGNPAEADPVAPKEPDDANAATPATEEPPGLRDLHAKLYVVERGWRAHVFVGSANATDAAFGGNVEMLCELAGSRSKLGIKVILDADNGLGGLLQEYAPGAVTVDEELDRLQGRLDELLRAAAELAYVAQVEPSGEQWRVRLASRGLMPPGAAYTCAPLNRLVEQLDVAAGTPLAAEFGPRVAADITAFYVLTATLDDARVEPRATVVRAELLDAPASRLDEIIARQVDTPEKFLRFLLLLLGATADGFPTAAALLNDDGGSAANWVTNPAGVLELLVTTLATRPHAIDDLASLVSRLTATEAGRAVLPARWDGLWAAVLDARASLVAAP